MRSAREKLRLAGRQLRRVCQSSTSVLRSCVAPGERCRGKEWGTGAGVETVAVGSRAPRRGQRVRSRSGLGMKGQTASAMRWECAQSTWVGSLYDPLWRHECFSVGDYLSSSPVLKTTPSYARLSAASKAGRNPFPDFTRHRTHHRWSVFITLYVRRNARSGMCICLGHEVPVLYHTRTRTGKYHHVAFDCRERTCSGAPKSSDDDLTRHKRCK
jgi:hypothetical protein